MAELLFMPSRRLVSVSDGTSLLDAAAAAGVEISAPCGAGGACGECRVRLLEGSVESGGSSCLPPEERSKGWILACSARVTGNATVLVPVADLSVGQIVVEGGAAFADEAADSLVRSVTVFPESPSLENSFSDFERLDRALRKNGIASEVICRLSALRQLSGAMRSDPAGAVCASVLEASDRCEVIAVEPGEAATLAYGVAIDIGTTTCAAHLIDLRSNRIVATAADYNGQRIRGLDVISRINYARAPDRLAELESLVCGSLNGLVQRMCDQISIKPSQIGCAALSGNTTMVHLLLGLDPDYIRLEPYTPTANRLPLLRASDVGLRINAEAAVLIAPSVGSYVGGDITAGLLQTPLAGGDEQVSLFLDIGTNGEIVVGNGEWLMCCAASAGPAFEGAGIACGVRAATGAIERVRVGGAGQVEFSVIGGGRPAGVCGSGLIDLLAELWRTGVLDSSGRLMPGHPRISASPDSSRNLRFCVVEKGLSATDEEIVISQNDITNLLRAKAAVYSACALMLRSVGLEVDAVSRVYVAGGFGRYLDLENAVAIGMLPDVPREKYTYLGNASLAGAHALLVSGEARRKVLEVADRLTYVELNTDASYMDEYTAALFIPHTDSGRFPSVISKSVSGD